MGETLIRRRVRPLIPQLLRRSLCRDMSDMLQDINDFVQWFSIYLASNPDAHDSGIPVGQGNRVAPEHVPSEL